MVPRNAMEVDKEKLLFQLFFLKNNDSLSVEVEEVEEIDFTAVKKRIEQEESVFIMRKSKKESNTTWVAKEDVADPWYFTRM